MAIANCTQMFVWGKETFPPPWLCCYLLVLQLSSCVCSSAPCWVYISWPNRDAGFLIGQGVALFTGSTVEASHSVSAVAMLSTLVQCTLINILRAKAKQSWHTTSLEYKQVKGHRSVQKSLDMLILTLTGREDELESRWAEAESLRETDTQHQEPPAMELQE